jgi:hypothetical protein
VQAASRKRFKNAKNTWKMMQKIENKAGLATNAKLC